MDYLFRFVEHWTREYENSRGWDRTEPMQSQRSIICDEELLNDYIDSFIYTENWKDAEVYAVDSYVQYDDVRSQKLYLVSFKITESQRTSKREEFFKDHTETTIEHRYEVCKGKRGILRVLPAGYYDLVIRPMTKIKDKRLENV